MRAIRRGSRTHQREAGATLLIVAGALVLILGLCAIAIDLVSLYVARNEAQRAADAAALAGASTFVSQGCTSVAGGCVAGGPQEAPAKTQAIAVAAQNPIFSQAPSNTSVSVSFNYPASGINAAGQQEEPQIICSVYRDTLHGNAMPTFFAKIFGISTVDVSATATAEAYNPSGGGTSVGTSCVRPFLVPNCDPQHPVAFGSGRENVNCPTVSNKQCASGSTDCQSYFFDPNNKGAVLNPGIYNPASPATGGSIGEPWQLHSNAGPSQWYLLGLGTVPSSGSQLRDYIHTCAPQVTACNNSLNSTNGKKVGPVDQGINLLINANGDGLNQGQDTICSPTSVPACATQPFLITGGANNPNPALRGATFYSPSSSIATVAVYDGVQLPPGGSSVNILGYMQLFILDAQHNATDDLIDTVVYSMGGCGTTSSNPPPVVGAAGSPIPIRLIHP